MRWSLDEPDGRRAFRSGHIPGAVYVSLEDELASHGDATDGRHPLPTREALQAAARGWGVNNGQLVVVYDGGPSLAAARAWWLLRHAGVEVRILDGGLAGWIDTQGITEQGPVAATFGDVDLSWGGKQLITVDEAAEFSLHGTLVDARAPERFRGEVEPIDPVAGHIPGAINAPTGANVGPDGRFLSVADLAERFASLGITGDAPIAVYCGSGVTAAHEIAALEIAGLTAALYPGSWSQWSNLDLPVATGESSRVRS